MVDELLKIESTRCAGISITDVGKRIRAARKAQRMTQQQLGEQTGLTRVSINKIEQGKRKQIKPDIIQKIALATGQPLDYFYGKSPKLLSDQESNLLPQLHPQLHDAIGRLSTLPFRQQERWARVIQELLDIG